MTKLFGFYYPAADRYIEVLAPRRAFLLNPIMGLTRILKQVRNEPSIPEQFPCGFQADLPSNHGPLQLRARNL
jgi:hypothetical protein